VLAGTGILAKLSQNIGSTRSFDLLVWDDECMAGILDGYLVKRKGRNSACRYVSDSSEMLERARKRLEGIKRASDY